METSAMRPVHSNTVSLPVTPAAVADAMAVLSTPDLASRLPESIRRMAWNVAMSSVGFRVTQRHRPANLHRGPQ